MAKQQRRKEPKADEPPKKRVKERRPIDIAREQEELRNLDAMAAAAKGRDDDESAAYLQAMLKELRSPGPAKSALKSLSSEGIGTEAELIVDQVNWIRRTGETPLEFLTRMYRHPLIDTKDRIAAAKACQDLVHQKMPTISVLKTNDDTTRRGITNVREKLAARLAGLAKGLGASVKGPGKAGRAA